MSNDWFISFVIYFITDTYVKCLLHYTDFVGASSQRRDAADAVCSSEDVLSLCFYFSFCVLCGCNFKERADVGGGDCPLPLTLSTLRGEGFADATTVAVVCEDCIRLSMSNNWFMKIKLLPYLFASSC